MTPAHCCKAHEYFRGVSEVAVRDILAAGTVRYFAAGEVVHQTTGCSKRFRTNRSTVWRYDGQRFIRFAGMVCRYSIVPVRSRTAAVRRTRYPTFHF